MDWLFPKYHVWVINTTETPGLYLWENWKRLCPPIGTLVQLAPTPSYIKSLQGYQTQNKWLGFGKMSWSEANNHTWTTKYREAPNSEELEFFNTLITAMDWKTAKNNDIFPDLFINLYNHPSIPAISEGLLIAIPRRHYKKHPTNIDEAIQALLKDIPSSTLHTVTRSWKPGAGFVNRIGDMNAQELQKIINHHS